MAVKSNKLTPVLVIVAFVIVGSVIVMRQNNAPTAAPMAAAPLPKTAGADEDTPSETLATVVAANRDLRADIQDVLRANQDFSKRLERLEKGTPAGPLLLVLSVVPAMTQIQPQSMSLSPLATPSTLLRGLARMAPAEVIVPLVAPRI